jgi:amidase
MVAVSPLSIGPPRRRIVFVVHPSSPVAWHFEVKPGNFSAGLGAVLRTPCQWFASSIELPGRDHGKSAFEPEQPDGMSGVHEYAEYDGLGLAELVRHREVSAGELLEEAIRRVEAVNPSLNAVIYRMYDHARAMAERTNPDAPFRGVPFLLKDILQAYAGFPLSSGSVPLREWVPRQNATVVDRFLAAGLIPFGKTNVPELGLVAYTEPEAFGPARNPWDLDRTPGGSSGGAAAAVAARVVPMAGASDGGGSIRIPASLCGLFGLKPTRGRVPNGPRFGDVWEGAVQNHVVTRTVRDSAAMLDAIEGPEASASYRIQRPERPYLEEVARDPGRLRIAFLTHSPLGGVVHPACKRAVNETADHLAALGHHMDEAAPDVDGMAVARAYLTLYFGQVAADINFIRREMGQLAVRKMEVPTRALAAIGSALSSAEYVEMRREWHRFSLAMAEFHQRFDILLTPTVAQPPARIGELTPGGSLKLALRAIPALRLGKAVLASGIIDRLAREQLLRTPFTQLANLTGQPAMAVPSLWTEDGLPVGVHFLAPVGDESTLFRLASQLEQTRPWSDHRPLLAEPEAVSPKQ